MQNGRFHEFQGGNILLKELKWRIFLSRRLWFAKKVEKHNKARSKDKSVDVQIYLETNSRALKKELF